MNTKYPNLLSPVKIGKVELRNRTVMAAMGMSQSDNGFVNTAIPTAAELFRRLFMKGIQPAIRYKREIL